VLRHVIAATEPPALVEVKPDTRNAAAVALGKLGASKGGKARALALTPDKRRAIAEKAARSRWEAKG
jgi:hypothetical protein